MANGGYRPENQRQAEANVVPAAAPVLAAPAPGDTPTPTDSATDAAAGPPPTWTIQPGGRLGFSVGSGDDSYRGSFSDWSGTITFDPEHPETAEIRIEVGLASASLGDATQDEMLQGGDFFASSANPTATWRSTSVRQTGPNRYSASGTLSLKGVSKPQSLTFTLSGADLRRHVEGSASIDRNAFAWARANPPPGWPARFRSASRSMRWGGRSKSAVRPGGERFRSETQRGMGRLSRGVAAGSCETSADSSSATAARHHACRTADAIVRPCPHPSPRPSGKRTSANTALRTRLPDERQAGRRADECLRRDVVDFGLEQLFERAARSAPPRPRPAACAG
jgi:polyisoprenoid-binding protein YceI